MPKVIPAKKEIREMLSSSSTVETYAGVLSTLLWFTFIAWFAPKFLEFEDWSQLGDFLAGITSPVAFLWLVLGYRQQGRELRLQAEEMRRAVEYQGELARVTAEQLHLEKENTRTSRIEACRARQPSPKLEQWPQSIIDSAAVILHISNNGGSVSNVYARASQGGESTVQLLAQKRVPRWDRDNELTLEIEFLDVSAVVQIFVDYMDSSGANGTLGFYITRRGSHPSRNYAGNLMMLRGAYYEYSDPHAAPRKEPT